MVISVLIQAINFDKYLALIYNAPIKTISWPSRRKQNGGLRIRGSGAVCR
jgi:hypothetical protein